MSGSDFVKVRLTEFGRKLCGAGEINVISGRHEFKFTHDDVQSVTKAFDWPRVLEPQSVDGEKLFEIVEEEPAAVAAGEVQQDWQEGR